MENAHGYYEMFGQAIKLAIQDYAEPLPKKKKVPEEKWGKMSAEVKSIRAHNSKVDKIRTFRETAESWIFKSEYLEDFLNTTGLSKILSIGFLRKTATEARTKGYYDGIKTPIFKQGKQGKRTEEAETAKGKRRRSLRNIYKQG